MAERIARAGQDGVPAIQVIDRPEGGPTYLESSRADGDSLVVRVSEQSRIAGWESTPLASTRMLTLHTDTSGRVRVTHDSPLNEGDLWDLPKLRGVHEGSALVIGDASLVAMRSLAHAGARAVPQVTAFWGGGWAKRVVIVAPASLTEFAQQLGDDPSRAGGFAAVTSGHALSVRTSRFIGSRVYVNPGSVSDSPYLVVILAHESTHVAAQAASRLAPPQWLSEGMADYVGFKNYDERIVAADLLAQVRSGQDPVGLPNSYDFDSGESNEYKAYAGSLIAIRLLVDDYGREGFLKFFGDVVAKIRAGTDSGAAIDSAFRVDLHTTVKAFTAHWLAELHQMAAD